MSFWQTTLGIFIKRIFFNTVAQASLVLYTGLVNNKVDWHAVGYAAAVQVVYVIMTTTRDYKDPNIPNASDQF